MPLISNKQSFCVKLASAETLNIIGHKNQKPYLSSLAAKQPIAIDKSRSMPFNVQPITN